MEEQAFRHLWKDIGMLTKELRCKLQQYGKEKTNDDIF